MTIAAAFGRAAALNARLQAAEAGTEKQDTSAAGETMAFTFHSRGIAAVDEARASSPTKRVLTQEAPFIRISRTPTENSIALALRSALAASGFLVEKPAEVMMFAIGHDRDASGPFMYNDPLYLDPYMWTHSESKALEKVDATELSRLQEKQLSARAQRSDLATFQVSGRRVSFVLSRRSDQLTSPSTHRIEMPWSC